MDPITVANIALGLISTSLGLAKTLGLVNPDVMKYAEAGLFIANKAKDMILNWDAAKYDSMTPAQVKAILAPSLWEDLEAEAARQIAAGE